jgi:hypothetical protein
LEALRLDTSKPAFCHGLKPSVVTHRDQIRLLARYEIAALLRRNRMILQMWRQSGLGLRQFGQKKLVSQEIAFIGVWAFWRAPASI